MSDRIEIKDLDLLETVADVDEIAVQRKADGVVYKAEKSTLKGDKGDTGDAATVDAGTTTTGAVGSDATVVNSGTTSAAVFDFTIPRGDKGEKGVNWQGQWSAGTYQIDDVVEHNGSSWIAVAVTTQEPSAVATEWDLVAKRGDDGGSAVDSVNGQTGVVVLDTDDITEGATNLYYTEARVSANTDVSANTTHRTATDNPHSTTLEQARTAGKTFAGDIEFDEVASVGTPADGIIAMGAIDNNGYGEIEVTNSTGLKRVLGRDSIRIVRNQTGSTIPAGTVVYVSGQTGNTGLIAPARSNSLTTAPAIGITMREAINNAFVPVMSKGVYETDTSAFDAGDVLYVSPDTAGALTATQPVHPNFSQVVGKVLVSGVGNGSIEVNTDISVQGDESGTIRETWRYGATSATTQILAKTATATRTATFPDKSGTVAFLDDINAGTVTSVAVSGSDGIEVDSGSPITSNGTIALGVNKTTMLTHLNVEDGAQVNTVTPTNTVTLTNKRITKRVTSEASSATPTINTDNTDVHRITALAVNITSMTTNLSGTPTLWQLLAVEFIGTATRTIAWGASFADSPTLALPVTTDGTDPLKVLLQYNGSVWVPLAVV